MATNTPKLNLVKPEMSDYADVRVLNGNMDILDEVVGGLDYVKDVTKSDTGLTFTKKDDTVVNVPLDYMPTSGGNFTGNIKVQNNQVIYATNSITDESGNYYTEYSDGSIVCGGVFTDLNQGGSSGGDHPIESYAKRVNYLQPITKTMIGFTSMLLPDDGSGFWGNSSACAMLRKPDNTGFYIEVRSSYLTMLTNTSKCMWRAYFK